MGRSCRALVILLIAFGFTALLCGVLLFVLAGDEIKEFGQTAFLRVTLALRENDLNSPAGNDSTEIRFVVRSGDNARSVSQKLLDLGLIADADLFVDYVRAQDIDDNLEIGKYFLNKTQSIREIAHSLTDSRFSEILFTIIPGQRIEQVAAMIGNNRLFDFSGEDFLAVVGRGAVIDPAFADRVGLPPGMSLEGFLYPDTYSLDLEITAIQLRDLLINDFITNVDSRRFQQAAEQGFTMYEVVTIASIVQREALHDDEKPRIASAYLNRLVIDMKLDADPTVQYGLAGPGNWWPQITAADYRNTISSYNTYINNGLPPGPIANPDLSSIDAVLNPETTNFYYFRADCRSDGYHEFATTFEEHLANGC